MSASSSPPSDPHAKIDRSGGSGGESVAQAEVREELRSEVADYLANRSERRRLLPRAALVGLLSGTLALLFRLALEASDKLRTSLLTASHGLGSFGVILPILFCAFCAGASVLLVRRLAPEASGSGIPHLEAVLRRLRPFHWKRVLPVKFTGGILAVGLAGLAAGREGPTVQMGGAIGEGVASFFGGTFKDRETLITAGAGAGLAAAFNAPLSGLVFVLEEVRREFTPLVFGAALVASVIANVVARVVGGQAPVFHIPVYTTPSLALLPAFLLLGVFAGLLGIVFNRAVVQSLNIFARYQQRFPAWSGAALVGGVIGLVGWFAPEMLGGGHHLAERTLAGNMALTLIPAFFLIRFLLTMVSYGCGAPGGIFAPLLGIGAMIGLAVGATLHSFWPGLVPHPGIFAVVGMAAYFTAIVRAPLTGIVLIVEMTGSYEQMLPLLAACFAAYAVTEALGDKPIYEVLLERDLSRGGETPHVQEPQVVTVTIERGSPFEGQRVRNLGLPPGCILVNRRRGLEDMVPGAETDLHAEDRITVIVSPEAADAISLLRHGSAS
jgi:CIC family chloride channel protein